MNTAVTARLSRWVAAFIAAALIAGGSIIVTSPAVAAPATVTGGSLDWGVAADYRAVFTTRDFTGGATRTAADTVSFPAATTSTYDPAAKTGTLNFQGNARLGYILGATPGVSAGNYFYVSNPVVTLNGTTGTISGTTAGDSHKTNPALPTAPLQSRDIATLDLSGVTPTVNSEGTLITFTAVPTAITAGGVATLATFASASDTAATARVVGSALDPVTIQLAIVAQPVAASTSVALTAPASAIVGAPVALSAGVTPATAAGSVEFFDGATSLGSAPVASATASTSVTFAAAGAHSITARFVPADSTLFAASTSAATVVTTTAAPVVTTPTVVVSKSTVVESGELVTVTGAGFSPVGTATNAARPPLAGKFGGVYVAFGKFAEVWKPSAGAASSARATDRSGVKWVVDPSDVASVGGAAAGGVAINADGTFSVQLLVKPGFSGEPATGNYGIYTYPGGGVSYAAFETYTPITFVSTPTVKVSKSTLGSAGETVTVTGSGFSPVGTATNAARPPLAGKFGGVYVTFGRFAEVWKPSAGAASAARPADRSTLKWFVNSADVATIGGAPAGGAAINPDGTFSVEMLVKPGYTGEPATGNYGVYTYPGGGVSYPAFETYTPIAFAAAPVATPTTTSLTADPGAVTVGGSTTLTAQVSPATAVGTVAFSLGSTPLGSVAVSGGVASMPVGDLAAGVQQFSAAFVPGNALDFGASTGSASVAVAEKVVVGAGSLTWGIKQSFREYVAGPIAKGTITTSGAGASGGVFTFGQAAGGNYDRATGVGTSAYSGTVRFSGHAGLLDVSIGNPVVRVDNAAQGTLLASVNGGAAIPFATLNLAAASRSTPNNTVTYAGVPAALTSQGASVFALNGSGFYEAGTPLDSVSFVIGAPNVIASVGATVASFKAPNTAAPTPPATTGIEVAQGTELTAGGEVTITASGFRPNETGILVVIYSTPTVLDTNAKADARGVVTWTGRLPAGLSGLHTLTLQGSVDRGVELNIAEVAATTAVAVGCVVDDATLTWGFKESFRAYISGAIANGEWTVADGATYAVPNFGWSAGTGGYDSETGEGSLAFAGSIAFTGHGGVLNTIVSNPQVRFVDATRGVLLLDVSGTTQDGAAVDTKGVEFADLDLSGVVANDEGSVTITAAPATLTAAGSAAFGTYPAGEALDPVTLAFSTEADCGVVEDEPTPISATEDDEVVAVSTTNDLTWIIWAALALLVIAAVVAVIVVRRRKK